MMNENCQLWCAATVEASSSHTTPTALYGGHSCCRRCHRHDTPGCKIAETCGINHVTSRMLWLAKKNKQARHCYISTERARICTFIPVRITMVNSCSVCNCTNREIWMGEQKPVSISMQFPFLLQRIEFFISNCQRLDRNCSVSGSKFAPALQTNKHEDKCLGCRFFAVIVFSNLEVTTKDYKALIMIFWLIVQDPAPYLHAINHHCSISAGTERQWRSLTFPWFRTDCSLCLLQMRWEINDWRNSITMQLLTHSQRFEGFRRIKPAVALSVLILHLKKSFPLWPYPFSPELRILQKLKKLYAGVFAVPLCAVAHWATVDHCNLYRYKCANSCSFCTDIVMSCLLIFLGQSEHSARHVINATCFSCLARLPSSHI